MKNNGFLFGVRAALTLAVVLILAGCGGADPKALVQESYKPGKKALDTLSDPALAEKLMKQATIIETKVAKLSEKGRKIYEEELARLIDDDLGGFFDDGLDGVMEAAAEMTDKAQKTADGMINATSKLADGFFAGDAQKALGAAQKAADMLTTLGNQ
jgi:hypothetical protein